MNPQRRAQFTSFAGDFGPFGEQVESSRQLEDRKLKGSGTFYEFNHTLPVPTAACPDSSNLVHPVNPVHSSPINE